MNKALVTGANKGIGYGIAKELIKRGWHVLVGARNKERGEAAVNKLNAIGKGKAEYLKVDLSNYTVIAST